jgi:hypothetical protein
MVHILKDYVKPIMQLLSNDIVDYNMRLIVTKCLNTAVMLVYFLLGEKGIRMANYCDTHATIKRHQDNLDNNTTLITSLTKDLLLKTSKRYIYYILLTDARFPRTGTEDVFFPGHVLVFEKIPGTGTKEPYYNIYQSYINQYDLKGYYNNTNNATKISYKDLKVLLSNLKYILESEKWDDKCIKYWKDLTFVDTTSMKDSLSKNRFFLCYQRALVSVCIEKVYKYVIDKLRPLKYMQYETNEIYGDIERYDASQNPLTKFQMKTELSNLLPSLAMHKKYSSNKLV